MRYVIFPIHMNEIERKQERDRLKKEALSFYKAIETRDPSAAKAIYDDKEFQWLCKKCPYLNRCIVMRNINAEKVS
jgi:MoaA/NifB/PqqE/SkfB family radical SAM enzyme